MAELTPAAIEALFREWWAQSYPTPPGVHAVNTHVGFGAWLLEQQVPIRRPAADELLAAARAILGEDVMGAADQAMICDLMWGALERWAVQPAD